MNGSDLATTLQLINTIGVTAVLVIFVRMFVRGDILPRSVYKEMTEKVVGEIATRILKGVTDMLQEWEGNRLHADIERLESQKAQLIRELGADNHLRGDDG